MRLTDRMGHRTVLSQWLDDVGQCLVRLQWRYIDEITSSRGSSQVVTKYQGWRAFYLIHASIYTLTSMHGPQHEDIGSTTVLGCSPTLQTHLSHPFISPIPNTVPTLPFRVILS